MAVYQFSNNRNLKIMVGAALLAGTLDLLSAFVDYFIATGNNPLRVLPFIASGVFGKAAFPGNAGMMLAGVFFHYLIAFLFTFFFFWLYSRTRMLAKNRVLTAIIYGLFIWMVMNLVVVQLSQAPHTAIGAMKWPKMIKSMLILICMIGLPLSFIAYRYMNNQAWPRRTMPDKHIGS